MAIDPSLTTRPHDFILSESELRKPRNALRLLKVNKQETGFPSKGTYKKRRKVIRVLCLISVQRERPKGRIGFLGFTLEVKHAPHLDALLLDAQGVTAVDAYKPCGRDLGTYSRPRRLLSQTI